MLLAGPHSLSCGSQLSSASSAQLAVASQLSAASKLSSASSAQPAHQLSSADLCFDVQSKVVQMTEILSFSESSQPSMMLAFDRDHMNHVGLHNCTGIFCVCLEMTICHWN